MGFEAPHFLWGLASLAPIVVLHLLRHRKRPYVEPSLLIWRRIEGAFLPGGSGAAPPALELLLSLCIAAALVLSAAGPWIETAAPPPSSVLFMLDRSASMACTAASGQGTRHESAVRLLRKAASRMAPGDSITFRCFPPLEQGDMELGPAGLDAALGSIPPPADCAAFPIEALAVESRHAEKAYDEAFLFSDGAYPAGKGPGPGVGLFLCGGRLDNVGITGLGFDRKAGSVRVFAEISSFSDIAVTVAVELRDGIGGSLIDSAVVNPAPRGTSGVVFGGSGSPGIPRSEVLEVRISPGGCLSADDRAYAVLEPFSPIIASIEGVDAPFLAKALEASGMVAFAAEPDSRAKAEIRIFHRTVPESAPSCPSILVDPPEGTGMAGVSGYRLASGGGFTAEPAAGPALAAAAAGISVAEYRAIEPSAPGFTPLVRFGSDVAVAALGPQPPSGGPSAVAVGLPVGPDRAPWVYEPSFPLFWAALLEIAHPMAGKTQGLKYRWFLTGKAVPLPGRDGDAGYEISGPAGFRTAAEAGTGAFHAAAAGLYAIKTPGGTSHAAVNLLSEEESDACGESAEGPCPGSARPADAAIAPLRLKAAFGLLALALILLLGFLAFGARGFTRAAAAAVLLLIPGCPENDEPGAVAVPGAGREIELESRRSAPGPEVCGKCGALAGEGHACGLSFFCPKCRKERSAGAHECGASMFCPVCRKERSLLNHRCGETSWCPKCREDARPGHRCVD